MSDHYLGMLDMRREVQSATRDQLIACVLALLDDPDVNQSVHLLALIGRNIKPTVAALPAQEPVKSCAAEHYVPWPSDRNLPCVLTGVHDEHRDVLGFWWNDENLREMHLERQRP